ncbi:MAG: helix-turn-helix transcriptional regulator [Gemmataceae bacterium]
MNNAISEENRPEHPEWTFLSNHSHVLLVIARDPGIRMREVAEKVGITERAVQRIVAELVAGGYLERERTGRRNHYRVHSHLPLRHSIEKHRNISHLLALVLSEEELKALSTRSEEEESPE